jgi:uncharacterized membrane protein
MMLTVARVAVRLAYPALILGSWYWDAPRVMGLLLLALLWLQRALGGGIVGNALRHLSALDWGVAVMLSLASSAIAWTGNATLLRLYPAAVNLGLLVAFGATLYRGPSMIERFARMRSSDLSVEAQRYTRRVTAMWCAFFVANGAFSVYTALAWEAGHWALYNGVIAYALIGALLSGEWLWRRFVLRTHRADGQGARHAVPVDRDDTATVATGKGGARA